MWSDVLLDALALMPESPVDFYARHVHASPRKRVAQTLHGLNTRRADLHLLLTARLQLHPTPNLPV